MAQFAIAYAITMTNEGGYASNSNDSGGETWQGVARNYWPEWSGWKLIDTVTQSTPRDMWNQTLAKRSDLNELVVNFYQRNYWTPLQLDNLQCQQTANQLFDTAVNMGVGVAAQFLQQAINLVDTSSPLTVDKRVGPLTIAAANKQVHKDLYNQINKLRMQRYESIVYNHPADTSFLGVWMERIKPFGPDADQTLA